MLEQHSLYSWEGVPQTSGQGGRRQASDSAISLVLRTIYLGTCTLTAKRTHWSEGLRKKVSSRPPSKRIMKISLNEENACWRVIIIIPNALLPYLTRIFAIVKEQRMRQLLKTRPQFPLHASIDYDKVFWSLYFPISVFKLSLGHTFWQACC